MSRQHEHDRAHRRMLRRRKKAEQRAAAVHGEAPTLLDELDLADGAETWQRPVEEVLDLARLLPRPLAWVLGGGGSYGAVQMGMVRALSGTDLAPDLVVGTSVGSLNGAVIAGDPGRGPEKLADLWPQIARRDVFPGTLWANAFAVRQGRDYLFDSGPLSDLITAQIPAKRIEDLAVPFVAVATDLDTGQRVEMDSGELRTALLASAAIPGIYPWVEREGRRLVDGGLVANVPIEVAASRGARSILVLDCGTFGVQGRWAESVVSVVYQALIIAARQQVVRDLQVARRLPVVYLPAPSTLTSTILDFSHTHELAAQAYDETVTMLAALHLVQEPLEPGLYGVPPLKEDHPEVAPLIRW
jgi:NTE family protein